MDIRNAEDRRVQAEQTGLHDEREAVQERNGSDSDAEYIVRRLTPTECARLQGFPDDWCSDVPHSDSAEYKMWGNGISLCTILPMTKAMADVLKATEYGKSNNS